MDFADGICLNCGKLSNKEKHLRFTFLFHPDWFTQPYCVGGEFSGTIWYREIMLL